MKFEEVLLMVLMGVMLLLMVLMGIWLITGVK